VFLGLALLLGLRSGLLRNGSVQPVLILLLKLRRRRDLVDGLEELESRIHLVLDVPELIVDGQGSLSLRAFVARLDQLGFVIPSRLVVDLATCLEVQSLSVERGA